MAGNNDEYITEFSPLFFIIPCGLTRKRGIVRRRAIILIKLRGRTAVSGQPFRHQVLSVPTKASEATLLSDLTARKIVCETELPFKLQECDASSFFVFLKQSSRHRILTRICCTRDPISKCRLKKKKTYSKDCFNVICCNGHIIALTGSRILMILFPMLTLTFIRNVGEKEPVPDDKQ